MFHLVARSEGRGRIWSTWAEGVALLRRIARACPEPAALVVMPDHVHLLHPLDVREALAQALAGHTRSRRTRDPRAVGFAPLPLAEALTDAQKVRRSVRYVHLNPCRAGLCRDPLGWPLSTHRDLTGFALPPLVRPRSDPQRLHAYVSADPTVDPSGTDLPGATVGPAAPAEVLAAVSALTRTTPEELRRRGPARSLLLAAAAEICGLSAGPLARWAGVDRRTVGRSEAPSDDVRRVRRVLGDPRFFALVGGPGGIGR